MFLIQRISRLVTGHLRNLFFYVSSREILRKNNEGKYPGSSVKLRFRPCVSRILCNEIHAR